MARVIIGGTEYEVPEMNFAALECAWPYVDDALLSLDAIKGPSAGISIIAAGLLYADHFDPVQFGITEKLGEEQTFERVVKFLKRKVLARELEQVRKAINLICEEAGLEPAEGEPLPPVVADRENPSPETVPTILPNLLQPVVAAETGN